ncbi:placenta-specific protein 9-like [Fundulus diaphanus]
MTGSSCLPVGFLLLLIGYTAAGLESDRQPRAVQSSICQEHMNLHKRLDVVEKRVENTVMKLEGELADLMEAIDAPQWRPLLDTSAKTAVDILEDPAQRGQ